MIIKARSDFYRLRESSNLREAIEITITPNWKTINSPVHFKNKIQDLEYGSELLALPLNKCWDSQNSICENTHILTLKLYIGNLKIYIFH